MRRLPAPLCGECVCARKKGMGTQEQCQRVSSQNTTFEARGCALTCRHTRRRCLAPIVHACHRQRSLRARARARWQHAASHRDCAHPLIEEREGLAVGVILLSLRLPGHLPSGHGVLCRQPRRGANGKRAAASVAVHSRGALAFGGHAWCARQGQPDSKSENAGHTERGQAGSVRKCRRRAAA